MCVALLKFVVHHANYFGNREWSRLTHGFLVVNYLRNVYDLIHSVLQQLLVFWERLVYSSPR